jgi:hypothetical protein
MPDFKTWNEDALESHLQARCPEGLTLVVEERDDVPGYPWIAAYKDMADRGVIAPDGVIVMSSEGPSRQEALAGLADMLEVEDLMERWRAEREQGA